MFDDLIRQINRMPTTQRVVIDLQLDADGYYDRRCPADECGAAFKVLFADWREKVPDEQAWCPICGEIAEPPEFRTPEQRRQIRDHAMGVVTRQFDEAVGRAHKPKMGGGLVTMSWSYQPGARRAVVPASAEPLMSQRSDCEVCGCRYASIGAAFFCPACGHNSARTTFAAALTTVRNTMDLTDRLGELISDRDVAADSARQFIETALGRVWSSFQRFAEAGYSSIPGATPPRRNVFQTVGEAEGLWKAATGKDYTNFLTGAEHRDLVRLVQVRHCLEHQHGLVDADYLAKSGDSRYRLGQRLVVTTADVRRLTDLAGKLAAGLTAAVPATKPLALAAKP